MAFDVERQRYRVPEDQRIGETEFDSFMEEHVTPFFEKHVAPHLRKRGVDQETIKRALFNFAVRASSAQFSYMQPTHDSDPA